MKHLKTIIYGVMSLIIVGSSLVLPFTVVPKAEAARAGSANCPTGRTLFGRAECIGYFTGADVYGANGIDVDDVIYNGGTSMSGVTNADQFISFIKTRVNQTGRDAIGAAFIVATMMGHNGSEYGSTNAGLAAARSYIPAWEATVRYYDAQGRVNWNQFINFNAPFQNSAHSKIIASDDIFYMKQDDESQWTIVFTNPNGTKFEIKKNCANLVGTPNPLVPPPNYNLTPTIGIAVNGSAPSSEVVQVGDSVRFTYNVNNSGATSDSVGCTIYGQTRNGYYEEPTNPESANVGPYTSPATGCPRTFPNNRTTQVVTETITITTANQTLCRSFFVNPATSAGGARGTQVCVVVAAKPYVRVRGGDVSAGNNMVSSNTCSPVANKGITSWNLGSGNNYAGAGTQYAAYAMGQIREFATAQGTGGTTTPSGLAFSNQGTNAGAGLYGGSFGSLPCIPDYYAMKPATTLPLANNSNMGALTTGAYSSNTGVTFAGGQVNSGQRTVVYVTGDVYITGNITYAGNWSYKNVPLFELVVKGNIYVAAGVTRLDGAYIAQPNGASGGSVYTCATSAAALPLNDSMYSTCNSKLTVNGLLSAKQIFLLRTNGTISQSSSSEASAELFNYNPTLWIAQPPITTNANTGNTGEYDAITSLPPVL